MNAYLINTGSKLVLIDTGVAGLFGPTLGNLLTKLKAADYQPEQVDEIYITHMHADHVGGLMSGAALTFPNAEQRISKEDPDFWLSVEKMNAAPDGGLRTIFSCSSCCGQRSLIAAMQQPFSNQCSRERP